MAHLVIACALKHHTRRGERDPERWQMVSQLVTHALLRDAGFTLPPDAEAWEDVSVDDGKEARLFAGVPARGVVFGRRLCAAAVGTVTSAGFCSEVGR